LICSRGHGNNHSTHAPTEPHHTPPHPARSPHAHPHATHHRLVPQVAAIGGAVTTSSSSAVGTSATNPAGDPISLIYLVQFVSVTSGIGGMPLAYKGMSNGFGLFNLEFNVPESWMRQPCGGREPCDESDPSFKGHAWTPDGYMSEEDFIRKMDGQFVYRRSRGRKRKLKIKIQSDPGAKIADSFLSSMWYVLGAGG